MQHKPYVSVWLENVSQLKSDNLKQRKILLHTLLKIGNIVMLFFIMIIIKK